MAHSTLRLHGLLCSGEFSSLFLAQRNDDHEITVAKCFNRACVRRNPEMLRRILREKWVMETLCRLPHPFIVGHRYAHIDHDTVFLGMENVGGGDIFSLLQKRGPFSPEQVRCYAGELCLALGHVHSFDIMYRDLKVNALPPPTYAPRTPNPPDGNPSHTTPFACLFWLGRSRKTS